MELYDVVLTSYVGTSVNLRWIIRNDPQHRHRNLKESFLLNQDKFLQESLPGIISSVVKKHCIWQHVMLGLLMINGSHIVLPNICISGLRHLRTVICSGKPRKGQLHLKAMTCTSHRKFTKKLRDLTV